MMNMNKLMKTNVMTLIRFWLKRLLKLVIGWLKKIPSYLDWTIR